LATSIRDNLELVLDGYEEAHTTETFGGRHELWGVFDALEKDFSESPSLRSRPTVRTHESGGGISDEF
jgi:hypothetical protein